MESMYMHIPAEIFSGRGSYEQIGDCARKYGTRVLLISEPVMQDQGICAKIQSELEDKGLSCLRYDDIGPEASHAGLQEAVRLARAGKAQMIVSVGGMRVLMAGRIAALTAGSNRSIRDLLADEQPAERALPCLEIPTSYRNPLQFADRVLVPEETTRVPHMLPMPAGFLRCVIVDPSLTTGLSGKYSAALLMDSILGGIEGYMSHTTGYIGRPLLRDGLQLVSESVLSVYNAPAELRPRIKACEGGLLTGLGLGFGRQGIGGALVYVLGSMYDVPKSWVATVLAPHVAEHWVPIVPQSLAEIAGAMGADTANLSATEAARQVPQILRRMIGQTDLPGRLRELDISMEHAKEAAELVMEFDMIRSCPRFPSLNDVLNLVKRAF
ncbi:iron-containing alcohol dehydrogenase [Spirochaeta africana]|uniref:Alcohol dehydrogenase, class IV n=1 Tax=Spirochaeta africana (strain ATCC 700263 / DSM 8902 / Z-7692) TaxID=889378 RepID=H9UFN9_SPIAZ|nr:iron-containing alcohol dehydrogenase [Spirochaeta africana]AFG36332.1 alcohol dehydrogenase, class IV [Spirochaeta africana DSM 8902]